METGDRSWVDAIPEDIALAVARMEQAATWLSDGSQVQSDCLPLLRSAPAFWKIIRAVVRAPWPTGLTPPEGISAGQNLFVVGWIDAPICWCGAPHIPDQRITIPSSQESGASVEMIHVGSPVMEKILGTDSDGSLLPEIRASEIGCAPILLSIDADKEGHFEPSAIGQGQEAQQAVHEDDRNDAGGRAGGRPSPIAQTVDAVEAEAERAEQQTQEKLRGVDGEVHE